MKNTWSEEDLKKAIYFFESGKNFKEISELINKSHDCVSKKLRRKGFKYNTNRCPKYLSYNWIEIQEFYENSSYRGIINNYKLTPQTIQKAIKHGLLKLRTKEEGIIKAKKEGRKNISKKTGIARYRQLCEFKFKLSDFPDEFDFDLIKKFGWYKAKNRGNNLNGVSRDHMFSVSEGFKQNIDPYLISHPANCKLIIHNDNQKKKHNSSITLEELKLKIKNWDLKYPIGTSK